MRFKLTPISVIAAVMVAGCASIPPEQRGPRLVQEVEVRVADGRPDAMVVPGEPIPLRVYAKDSQGLVYGTYNGSLGKARIRIEARNMEFDPVAFTLTPAKLSPEELVQAEYSVTAYVDNVPAEKTFAVDVDKHLGPSPDKIASLQVAYGGQAKPDYLRPGHPIALDVTVTDTDGRRYVLGSTNSRIAALPADRLVVETDLVEWDPHTRKLTPELDAQTVGEKRYQVRVSYRARAGEADSEQPLVVERAFIPDFIGLNGPEASAAKDVRVEIGDPPVGKRVTPGVELPVRLMVLGPEGRWHEATSPHHRLGIPIERFTVRTRQSEFDPQTSTLALDPATHKLAGNSYEIDVRYEGSRKLRAAKKLDPDYLAAVKPLLMTTNEISLQGKTGPQGRAGAPGQMGQAGADNSAKWGRGSHAGNGGDGREGGEGGEGGPGPTVVIAAVEATTLDKKVPLVFFTIQVDGGEPKRYLRRLDSTPMTIISRGGDGGPGGPGGAGGKGGEGGDGWSTGDGGDGGNGANGGPGGFGGPGGAVRLIASSSRVKQHFVLKSLGGGPGKPGEAGAAGKGGESGSKVTVGNASGMIDIYKAAKNNTNYQPPQSISGSDGKRGRPGKRGQPGRAGSGGDVEAKVGVAARAIEKAASEQVRDVVYFEAARGR